MSSYRFGLPRIRHVKGAFRLWIYATRAIESSREFHPSVGPKKCCISGSGLGWTDRIKLCSWSSGKPARHHCDEHVGLARNLLPMKMFSLAMGGWPLGYWLQTQRNFFAKKIVPHGIYHTEKVTEDLRKAYTDPFPTPESRKPTWIFPRQIRKARSWLADIESKLPVLADLPAQILWGTKDSAGFPHEEMERWQKYLKMNETEVLSDASHYVQEDRPDRVAASIRRVLEEHRRNE